MAYVEYDSNNSGGNWWLKDEDWYALEKAGWVVVWSWLSPKFTEAGDYARGAFGMPLVVPEAESGSLSAGREVKEPGYRWLGALARTAYRPGVSLREAAEEWERITGKSSTDAGCPCCGQPHRFIEYDDDGKLVASGPDTSYVASWS